MKTLNELVQELVPGYLAARKEEVGSMTCLLSASDFERLRVLSHSLKGSGSSFGFAELTRLGAELERHAESRDAVGFAQQLARLKDYLEHLNSPPSTQTNA